MPGKPAPVPTSIRLEGGLSRQARMQVSESRKCLARIASEFADRGQVKARIPVQQFLFVTFKTGELASRKANAKQVVCVLRQFLHKRFYYTREPLSDRI